MTDHVMTVQVRFGVFETNSSSTHSMTMCSQSDFDAWRNGKVYLNDDRKWSSSLSGNKAKLFVTKDEVIEILTNSKYPPDEDLTTLDDDDLNELFRENSFYTMEYYFGNEDLETFEESFVTPGGETVVAFGKYGYDG